MLLLTTVQPHGSFAVVYLLLYRLQHLLQPVRTLPQPFAVFIQCLTPILIILSRYLESLIEFIDGSGEIEPHRPQGAFPQIVPQEVAISARFLDRGSVTLVSMRSSCSCWEMALSVPSMVVSLSLAEWEEEKERESCGSLVICMEELRWEKPVEASIRFFREAMSAIDWLKMLSLPYCRADRFILNKIITHTITGPIITKISVS